MHMTKRQSTHLEDTLNALHIQVGDLVCAKWATPYNNEGLLIYLGIDSTGQRRFLEYDIYDHQWILRKHGILGECLKSVLQSFRECQAQ